MQICPWCMNEPKLAAATARSRSASARTTSGALPPSSSSTRFRCRAAVSAMMRPTRVEPVKLMRRTAGCAISSSTTSAASLGSLVTRLIAPGGTPASFSASTIAACVRGHISEALRTTVLPYASGAATARTPSMTGAFQGAMPTTTPTGWRTAFARLPAMCEGISSSAERVGLAGVVGEHAGRELHVEHAPAQGATRLLGDEGSDVGLALHQELGRALEQPAPLCRRRRRPVGNACSAASTAARACARAAGAPRPTCSARLLASALGVSSVLL